MNETLYALSLLTPYDIDVPKVRLGPNEDGGYVFADMLDPASQPVMSYGIAKEYRFDKLMAERGHHVYMFDHTINGIENPHERMHYFKEGVAGNYPNVNVPGVTDEAERLYSIADHIKRHNIPGDRIILKMDVEGAEFGAFLALDDATMDKIEQITLEVHSLESLECSAQYREGFTKTFENLNRRFTLFHVHANNVDGPTTYHYVEGMPVSVLMELSFIKTDRVKRRPSETAYPTVYDHPNFPHRDRLLWMFPFLPQSPTPEAFAISLAHVIATDPTKED